MIWLDPEPERNSLDYKKYTRELQEIERKVDLFRGFQQPPTEDEYMRLCTERFPEFAQKRKRRRARISHTCNAP